MIGSSTRPVHCLLIAVAGAAACQTALAQPLGEHLKYPQPVRLTFSGKIDGSEVIEISASHAHWVHRHWGWPSEAVHLNDVAWTPRSHRSLDNQGATRYLSRAVAFNSARLVKRKGRDTVALEVHDDLVRVHISDAPNGAALYEFDIVFDRRPTPQALHIRADIDGSDTLLINKEGALWMHRHWDWPNKVMVGRVHWQPRKTPKLSYAGLHLHGAVDFATAELTVNQARDLVVLERRQDGIAVHFSDSPVGRATYDVIIRFGP